MTRLKKVAMEKNAESSLTNLGDTMNKADKALNELIELVVQAHEQLNVLPGTNLPDLFEDSVLNKLTEMRKNEIWNDIRIEIQSASEYDY